MTATDEPADHTQEPQPHSPAEGIASEHRELMSPPVTSNTSQPISAPLPLSELSSTPPAASTPNADGNPPPAQETPADPQVATLLGMFPDFDISLLQSVLESVAGDQDRAVDVLLGMSDPSYTSTERADVVRLFARRLTFLSS
jgi:hypothetical protein